jgi:drug/metabolite transporter superfamily protein YnfA
VRDSFVTFVTKTLLFQAIFEIFSTFLIFLWIVEHINTVAGVNAHLMMYHMYKVSAPIT